MSLPEHTWYMQMLWNVFNAWLPEGKREKWRMGKKRSTLLNLLTVSLARREEQLGEVQQQCWPTSLFTPLKSETAVSDRIAGSWYLEVEVLFTHLDSHKLCAGYCKNAAQLPAMEWGAESWHCARSWNWPKLTVIYHPDVPWKFQSFSRLQTFK